MLHYTADLKLKQMAQKAATLQDHITLLEKELAAEVKENKQMTAELHEETSVITASLSDEEKFYQGWYRCSALFGNLRNFETVLRKLLMVAKLCG